MKSMRTTRMGLRVGCVSLGARFRLVCSHRPPGPLEVFPVKTNSGLSGSMVPLADGTPGIRAAAAIGMTTLKPVGTGIDSTRGLVTRFVVDHAIGG